MELSDRRAHPAAAAAVLVLLSGCAAEGPPKPSQLSGSIVAAPDLNPDASGRASPVLIRVYQLRSDSAFNNALFFDLFDNDQATLGPEMCAKKELTVSPGQTQPYAEELGLDCSYIGVMAGFRDYEQATWRAVTQVPAQETIAVQIKLDSLAVSVSAGP